MSEPADIKQESTDEDVILDLIVICPSSDVVLMEEENDFALKEELVENTIKTEMVQEAAQTRVHSENTETVCELLTGEDSSGRLSASQARRRKHEIEKEEQLAQWKNCRKIETKEQRSQRLAVTRATTTRLSAKDTEEERARKLAAKLEQIPVETAEKRALRLAAIHASIKKHRETETEEERTQRLLKANARRRKARAMETEEKRSQRLAARRAREKILLEMETEEERSQRCLAQPRCKIWQRTAIGEEKDSIQAASSPFSAKSAQLAAKCDTRRQNEVKATETRLKQQGTMLAECHGDTATVAQCSSQPAQPSTTTTTTLSQIHSLHDGDSRHQSTRSTAPVDTDKSSDLYFYKVDSVELACQLVEQENKHVYLHNASAVASVGDQLYQCEHCCKSFKSASARLNHYRLDHPGVCCSRQPDKVYQCILCCFTCLHLEELLRHVTSHHRNVYWELFVCGVCQKLCTTQNYFRIH